MVGLLGAAAEARFELIDLQNRTSFLCIDGDAHVDALRGAVSDRSGILAEHLRLTCAGRELHDAMPLAGLHQHPVRVLLRLLGGKGGFGELHCSVAKQEPCLLRLPWEGGLTREGG